MLSFLALVFTFDAISGEVERGTLRLTLSNSVARGTVLAGKFFKYPDESRSRVTDRYVDEPTAAFWGPFKLKRTGMGANRRGFRGKLDVSFHFLSPLGFSSLHSRIAPRQVSVILLLLWVIWVLLIPATFGTILSGLNQPLSAQDHSTQRSSQRKEITERL